MAYASLREIQMYYESHGDGTPLLFISGTADAGEHWKYRQVPFFKDSYRTIIFDHRGTGRTDRPEGPYSTRMFAEDAAQLLQAIGVDEPAHVVGHSMGGRVAQWLAIDHPELVRSVVLAASGPGPVDGSPPGHGIPAAMVMRLMEYGWPGLKEHMHRSSENFVNPDPEVVERYLASHRGQFGTDVRSFIYHSTARNEHYTTDRLQQIDRPCFAIVGSEDEHGSQGHVTTSRYLVDHIEDAELFIIPDAAHALHIETADLFNAKVSDYLARH